jgi:hypothetical protein
MTLLANKAPAPSARRAVSITAPLTSSVSISTCALGRLLVPHPDMPVLLAGRTQAHILGQKWHGHFGDDSVLCML